MNILKRLQNLWWLSEIDVRTTYGKLTLETMSKVYNETCRKPQMAQIIKNTNEVDEFLNS